MEKIILTTYKRQRDSDLTTTIKRVVGKMENNPHLLDPPAELAKLKALSPGYDNAVVNARGREKEMVAIKKGLKAEAVVLLTVLANYVTTKCNGDEAMLLSSGFDISGQSEQQSMSAIAKLQVELGQPGEVTISVKRVRGARAYMHQYTIEPPTSDTVWVNEGSTDAFCTFRGLKSYTKYWFRIVALGTNGQISYSPVDSRVIQ